MSDSEETTPRKLLYNKPSKLTREPSEESIGMESLYELERQQSGINIDYPENDNFKIIRSIVMTKDGKLQLDMYLKEIFSGFFKPQIEYVGFPSTIMLDPGNVVMASQIFDRPFHADYKTHGNYRGVRNIEEYFAKRNELSLARGEPKPVVTWIGSPSIIFDYTNRIQLRNILGKTGLNMIFWLTSFNSSGCITHANLGDPSLKYCDKVKAIKKTCNNKQKYQIHSTYSSYMAENNKFITNFEDAVRSIKVEEEAIDEYNLKNHTNFYQRYNELLTYFFPWDISGIELGKTDLDNLKETVDMTNHYREVLSENYSKLLLSFPIKKDLVNHFKRMVRHYLDVADLDLLLSPPYNYKTHELLFCKFLLYCLCGNIKFTAEQIEQSLDLIINFLNEPLKVYEYVMHEDIRKGEFFYKGDYINNDDILIRQTPFSLFVQELDPATKITRVVPIDVPFFEPAPVRGPLRAYKKKSTQRYVNMPAPEPPIPFRSPKPLGPLPPFPFGEGKYNKRSKKSKHSKKRKTLKKRNKSRK